MHALRARTTKNRSLAMSLVMVVAGMLMLSYAAVPLYSMFCKITGYGGTPMTEAMVGEVPILPRTMTVGFNTDVASDLPWSFVPLQKSIDLKVGERKLAFFEAKNLSDDTTIGVSTFNVTPHKAGSFFVKTKCFCFDNQKLEPKQSMRFAVSFYLDPALAEEDAMDEVKNITLSYTFFQVKEGKL
jgi:cytochrome c oxidase assembly protein subunit 11